MYDLIGVLRSEQVRQQEMAEQVIRERQAENQRTPPAHGHGRPVSRLRQAAGGLVVRMGERLQGAPSGASTKESKI